MSFLLRCCKRFFTQFLRFQMFSWGIIVRYSGLMLLTCIAFAKFSYRFYSIAKYLKLRWVSRFCVCVGDAVGLFAPYPFNFQKPKFLLGVIYGSKKLYIWYRWNQKSCYPNIAYESPFILIEYNFTYKTKNIGFQKLFYATV